MMTHPVFAKDPDLLNVPLKGEFLRECRREIRNSWHKIQRLEGTLPNIREVIDTSIRVCSKVADWLDTEPLEKHGMDVGDFQKTIKKITGIDVENAPQHGFTTSTEFTSNEPGNHSAAKEELAFHFRHIFVRCLAAQEGKESIFIEWWQNRQSELLKNIQEKDFQQVEIEALYAVISDIIIADAEKRQSPLLKLMQQEVWGESFLTTQEKNGVYAVLRKCLIVEGDLDCDTQLGIESLRRAENTALAYAREKLGLGNKKER